MTDQPKLPARKTTSRHNDTWRPIGESAAALVEVIQRRRLRYRAGEEATDSSRGDQGSLDSMRAMQDVICSTMELTRSTSDWSAPSRPDGGTALSMAEEPAIGSSPHSAVATLLVRSAASASLLSASSSMTNADGGFGIGCVAYDNDDMGCGLLLSATTALEEKPGVALEAAGAGK